MDHDGAIVFSVRSSSITGKASVQLLIAIFLVNLQLWQTSAQDGSALAYLNVIQNSVQDVAAKLAEIYTSNACGSDPQVCSICSQDLCSPLPDNSTSCLRNTISDLYNCASLFGSSANSSCSKPSLKIMKNRSSISFVRSNFSEEPTDLQEATICRTQQLDPIFEDVSSRTLIYTSYYVGMVDGSLRIYPGRAEVTSTCVQFDSRKRPWYTGGISYPNYLVILIDCGHDMRLGSTRPGSGRFRLDDAKDMALELLGTLYEQDYVNVLSFGGNSDDVYNTSVWVDVNYTSPDVHPELTGLQMKIQSLTPAEESSTVTKFLTGLNTSLVAFKDTLPDVDRPPRLRNVIVLTDGSFTDFTDVNFSSDPSVNAVFNQLRSDGVRLFIYGINAGESHQTLQTLADEVNGVYENVTDVDNPLYVMRSYFGYLASAHRSLYGDRPFFGTDYVDSYGVGSNKVTVTVPAFTDDNRFIGVVASDIILDEVPFRTELTTRITELQTSQDETRNTASGNITSSVPSALEDSSCRYNQALCPTIASAENAVHQKCCSGCGELGNNGHDSKTKGKDTSKTLGIILGSVLGVVVLVAVAIAGFKFYPRYISRINRTSRGLRDEGTGGDSIWNKPV